MKPGEAVTTEVGLEPNDCTSMMGSYGSVDIETVRDDDELIMMMMNIMNI